MIYVPARRLVWWRTFPIWAWPLAIAAFALAALIAAGALYLFIIAFFEGAQMVGRALDLFSP